MRQNIYCDFSWMWTKHFFFFFLKRPCRGPVVEDSLLLSSVVHSPQASEARMQPDPRNELPRVHDNSWLNTLLLETCLFHLARKRRLKTDALRRKKWILHGLNTFQLYQVGILFSANIIIIFSKLLQWLSGKSLYCRMGSLNSNSFSPQVATFWFLC